MQNIKTPYPLEAVSIANAKTALVTEFSDSRRRNFAIVLVVAGGFWVEELELG
jgi:hypothetical protein